MKYLIFTYDIDGNYSTSYTDSKPTNWENIRVFELTDSGLYVEIFI